MEYYPCDFQRAARSLKPLSYWRAHECRQFLLYTWYTVLHEVLLESNRFLFRLLHVFARILANPWKIGDRSAIDYAIKTAEVFIAASCETFGNQRAIYNVHGLLHVPEDVFKFGCLDHDFCSEFESFMFILKHYVQDAIHWNKQLLGKQDTNEYF